MGLLHKNDSSYCDESGFGMNNTNSFLQNTSTLLRGGGGTQNTSYINVGQVHTRESTSDKCSQNINIFGKNNPPNGSIVSYGKEQKLIINSTNENIHIAGTTATATLRPSDEFAAENLPNTPSQQR